MGTSEVSIEYSGTFAAVAVAVTRCSGAEASPPPRGSAGRERSEEGDDGGGRDNSVCHADRLCAYNARMIVRQAWRQPDLKKEQAIRRDGVRECSKTQAVKR